jgi:cytoskeletal protein CcmA (bactofilin family)
MSKENFKEVETIIGPTVRVEGDFKADGNIVIDGQMEGNLKTKKGLRVGEGARIKADVEAESAWIGGEVVGNLLIQGDLELSAQAKITGNITTQILTVATGAQINGQIKMGEGGGKMIEKEEEEEKE